MRKNFKKLFCGALSFILASNVFSFYVFSYNVGDVIGKILSTDIVTYIEGVRVPSYNINGRTAVIAQNLNALGKNLNFGVSFDEETRTLTITDTDVFMTGQEEALIYNDTSLSKPVGTPVGDVYYTDITTNFNGTFIESFNIGGLTCVYSDDLAKLCGTYIWDEDNRTVNVYRSTAYIPSVTRASSGRALAAQSSVISHSDTFNRWGQPLKSYLTQNPDGTFTAVQIDEHINIETYDSAFNHLSSFAIKKELPLVGTLLFGKDYNYIAYGQENLLEDNSREIIKIVIYDKSFVKISEVSVNNCKTSIPFDASGASMAEDENHLVLHTSRSQYLDKSGSRPQTQLTIIVDKSTWTVSNVLGKFQHNHISHALQEFVKIDSGRLITANLSDAAPIRGAFLQELDFSGKIVNTHSIFNVGGALAANCTGIMIGGLECSESGYFVPISTIDHSLATGYSSINIDGIQKENRDIYLLWTDKNTYEMRHTCLARYTGVGLSGSVPYIVKLSSDSFMVLWQRFTDGQEDSNTLCFSFIDGSGNQIGNVYTVNARLSKDCAPILAGESVVWYVNTPEGREFFSVRADISALTAQKQENVPAPAPSDKEQNDREEEKDKITEVDGI